MNRSIIYIIVLLTTSHLFASDYIGSWGCAGVQYGGLRGTTSSSIKLNNEFDSGYGLWGEYGLIYPKGWAWLTYGTGVYGSNNRVMNNISKAVFYMPYYTEIRKYSFNHYLSPYISLGLGWNCMHFNNTHGRDDQFVISTGAGAHYRLGKETILQMMFKPYYVSKNSLKQDWGIEMHFALGFVHFKNDNSGSYIESVVSHDSNAYLDITIIKNNYFMAIDKYNLIYEIGEKYEVVSRYAKKPIGIAKVVKVQGNKVAFQIISNTSAIKINDKVKINN
jgi:hypothetical protein